MADSAREGVEELERLVSFNRKRYVQSEQRFDYVVGMLLRGEKVCIRCWEPESRYTPGPPSPPQTKGHLGATENRRGCCNDFLALTRERWEEGDGTGIAS